MLNNCESFFKTVFVEHVAVPDLLNSVYNQIDSLLNAFNQQSERKKREAKPLMDCKTFVKVLSLYEELKPLISTTDAIKKKNNLMKIQQISNKIQMYSAYDGISEETCKDEDQSTITLIVDSVKSSLGNIYRHKHTYIYIYI
jgi:hypothetical protein